MQRGIVGGAQTYQAAAFAELRSRGHEVALLHEVSLGDAATPIDGNDPAEARWCITELGEAGALGGVHDWRPDVVYAHGFTDPELEAKIVARYPSVLYAHSYYGTCATARKLHSWPALQPCTRTLGPMCLAVNYVRGCGARDPLGLLSSYRAQHRRLVNLPRYGAIAVASHHMVAEYERHGVPSDRIELLPLFPGTVPEQRLPPVGPPTGVIVFASRLTWLKGGAFLVDALPAASAARGRPRTLVVAGDGPERSTLEERAAKQGVQARFLGWLGKESMVETMRTAELVAVPSLWPEPFGLVGIEAGRYGVPAVAFANGGILDWLLPGESGELAPSAPTAAGLADAIVRALRDPVHYARLREGAWRVSRRFAREAHVEGLERLLRRVAAGAVHALG